MLSKLMDISDVELIRYVSSHSSNGSFDEVIMQVRNMMMETDDMYGLDTKNVYSAVDMLISLQSKIFMEVFNKHTGLNIYGHISYFRDINEKSIVFEVI